MSKRSHQDDDHVKEDHISQLLVEIIEFILLFLCVRGGRGEEDIENHCMMISRLRKVSRLFSQLIDSSLTLWQKVLSFTRRATVQPPPLVPKGVPEIKAFVLLDNREFKWRQRLVVFGKCCGFGHFIHTRGQTTLDYREVDLGEYLNPNQCVTKNQVQRYDNEVKRYREIIEKMNDLCGYNNQ